MEIPDLFDEVYSHTCDFWRDKIEEADDLCEIKTVNEVKAQLDEKLDGETKKLAVRYGVAVENKMDYICYQVCRRLFFFSIKAGMEMQKAFDEEP